MEEQTYPNPVARLLTLGRPEGYEASDWARSVVSGLTCEHVRDLIRVLDDPALNDPDADDLLFYGPVHAWRALGHFKAAEAIDALIGNLQTRQRWKESDDWSIEDIPKVLREIGPDAIAPMVNAIADPATEGFSASALAEGLAKIAAAHPDQRERITTHLIELGERFTDLTEQANTGIVMALLDLKAIDAVPLLRRIFHAQAVDHLMVGDWSEVRRELELERLPDDPPEREPGNSLYPPDSPIGKLQRRLKLEEKWESMDEPAEPSPSPTPPVKHSAKWHRKQAKKHKQQTRRC